MARIRTIKPEFPEDEELGVVSRDARFLYVLIWTRCDDLGRLRSSPSLLASHLFPYDDDVTAKVLASWVDELVSIGKLHLYEVNGQQYAEVANWGKHQRIDNASKQNLMPSPPWADNPTESPTPSATRGDSPPLAAGEEGSGRDQEGSGGGGTTATARAESALGLLADRITNSKRRDQPARYRQSTLKGLRTERGVEAHELANRHPDWPPERILDELEPKPGGVRVVRDPDPGCGVCAGTGQDTRDPEIPCSCKFRRTA